MMRMNFLNNLARTSILRSRSMKVPLNLSIRLNHSPRDQDIAPAPPSSPEVLYCQSQHMTVTFMGGITFINLMYWSSQIANYFYFYGQVVEGIDLAGDPTWGYFGLFSTGIILYFTRKFAHHAVYQIHITPDGKRMGIQVHNIFGKPGKKYEVPIGNVKLLKYLDPTSIVKADKPDKGSSLMNLFSTTSSIPFSVEGFTGGNLLLDRDGLESGVFNSPKLVTLLNPKESQVDPKNQRVNWRKSFKN